MNRFRHIDTTPWTEDRLIARDRIVIVTNVTCFFPEHLKIKPAFCILLQDIHDHNEHVK